MARILIIDDNAPNRRTMPAEVIITAILLPEQEGFETMRELRRDFPATGIIALSGGGQTGCDTLLAIAERLGIQHVLQKPFGLHDRLDAVQQLLQR
jgi:CheY-like chemotaxis protein